MPTLTFSYTIGVVQSVFRHIANAIYGGSAELDKPHGFGRGDHYWLPLDANGRVDPRPGPDHRSYYIGASGNAKTYTAAQIEAAEGLGGGTVSGAWLSSDRAVTADPGKFWGQHPDYAVDTSLRYAVTQALLQGARRRSLWIHFERGGSYESLGYLQDGCGGSGARHPLVYRAYGSGAEPIIQSRLQMIAGAEDHLVLEDLDYSTIIDGDYNANAPLNGRTSSSISFNQPTTNFLMNRIHCGKGVYLQGVSRVTLRDCLIDKAHFQWSQRNSTAELNALNDTTVNDWGDGATTHAEDRIQAVYATASHLLFRNTALLNAGWNRNWTPGDGFLTQNQPPSELNHGLYLQNASKDITFIENVLAFSSSQGAKFQVGANVQDSLFFENPHHFYTWGARDADPAKDQPDPSYSAVYGNVMIGSLVRVPAHDLGPIRYYSGYADYKKDQYPFVEHNALLHAANPNDPAEITARSDASDPDYVMAHGDAMPWTPYNVIGNWADHPDQNVTISETALNNLTMHHYVDGQLSQATGTATTSDVQDWLETMDRTQVSDIIGYFMTGLGLDWATSFTPGNITFTPDGRGDGYRWDGRYNWSLKRRPVDGDTVNLAGIENVTVYENAALAGLDLGTDGSIYQVGGRITTGTLSGSGTITIEAGGETIVSGASGASVAANVEAGGALSISGAVDGLSPTVAGVCVIAPGGALTIASDKTMSITGATAAVGFDGTGGGSASLIIAGTLSMAAAGGSIATIGEVYTGLAGLDPNSNQPRPVDVVSAVTIQSGATLAVDVTGLASGTYDLIVADSVTGTFDTVNVTGGSGSVAYTATKVQVTI